MTYIIILAVVLIGGVFVYLKFKRNPFNKHKYVRVEKYNSDKSISVSYIKRENFNLNKEILINENHVFNFHGYTTIIISSNAQETINPLDFTSKFDAGDFKTAIRSKLIHDTFDTLKVDRFDKVMALLFLNVIQLLAIGYLIYELVGGQIG